MKAPDINELITESHPQINDYLIEQLKNKIYELEQENLLYKQDNYNLKEEIINNKKIDYENKAKLSLLMTQLNNLRGENDKLNKSIQEMKIINQKLYEDNKTLMNEYDKKFNMQKIDKEVEKKDINQNNEDKNKLEQKNEEINKLNSELVEHEEYIKKLFEDNKQLNEKNKIIVKETEEKLKELNINIKLLNEELNLRDDKIQKLEDELNKINSVLEETNNDNINLNNINLSLKEKIKELMDISDNDKNNILTLEQKNNLILIELDKKEKLINEYQQKYEIQQKQIVNLTNKNNSMINKSKDSLLLMDQIKQSHFDLYNKYETSQKKLDEINNLFKDDDTLEKILIEVKEEINNGKNNKIYYYENTEENDKYKEYPNENNNNNVNEINESSQINNNYNENEIKTEKYNNFRNYIYDTKDNEEITMDKKYDFLYEKNHK
jgi:N-terminal acetyltransferase B complex non-catalytic subunit